MKTKVSVIVPIYNVEKLLKKAVDSLVNQTLSDIEIILVDDGSPDNCGRIIDEYAKEHSNIVAVHKENGGVSDARNVGMSKATGEYIGFLDPDDFAEPEMFEKLHSCAKENDSDLVFC
ncbi:MAG: glycosyltransferase, partial [Clostridia bacterium]|nr:glycosyltransferase [Clostridia bacterium]